ncbi:MAG: DUF3043 domain-containing protein [Actinomycetes bacterium]
MFGLSGRDSSASTSPLSRFRRSAPANEPDASAKDGGKGRPTPKRREAESGRRRAVTAPRDRKEAYRQARERGRENRGRQVQALKAGDERALPARDRGPVRKYARDLVDARRSVAEFFLPLALLILLLTTFGTAQMQLFGGTLWLALVVLIVVDSLVLVFRLRRGLGASFPDESHRGAIPYALMRSMQIRRFRLPPPRTKSRGRGH